MTAGSKRTVIFVIFALDNFRPMEINIRNNRLTLLAAVLLCFFTAGSLDLVGTAANAFKEDLGLSGVQTGAIPALLYVWFLLLSIPTGLLMNRRGRRNTVLMALGLVLSGLAMALLPESYPVVLAAMALLGAGNTMLIVALNPWVASMISGEMLASSLTAGQCVKAVAGMIAPAVAAWGARALSLGWRAVFVMYAVVVVIAAVLLLMQKPDSAPDLPHNSFRRSFSLMGRRFIALSFVAVLCHVGSDCAINMLGPRLYAGRVGMPLSQASLANSLYFGTRLAGAVAGIFLLRIIPRRTALILSVGLLLAGVATAFFAADRLSLGVAICLMGLGNANMCTVIIAGALLSCPDRQNDASALMTMGLAGGALFPPLTSVLQDSFGLAGGLGVVAFCGLFLMYYALARD